MNQDIIINLINSEINDWNSLWNQRTKNEELRNSEHMKLYNKNYSSNNNNFEFLEEVEILNILEKIDKKISKKANSKNKLVKKYQKATEKFNQKLMQKYEDEIQKKDIKIKTLNLIKEENKEKIKDLELKRCELLKNNDKNDISLSKEDTAIRNIENKIWKMILDDYFDNKNDRILKLNEYDTWFSGFKNKVQNIKNDLRIIDKKNVNTFLEIAKDLYNVVSRDKLFLKTENIKTDGFETVNLFEDEGIGDSINSDDLQNQPSTSEHKQSSL